MNTGIEDSKGQRFNRTLVAINDAYSVFDRARTEQELYSLICEALTSQNEFSLAWVGIPINDEKKSVEVCVCAGSAVPYLDEITVSWGDNPYGNGPVGRAFRTGKIQLVNNRLDSRHFSPWMTRANEFKLQSVFSLPLKNSSGQVVAVVTVYSEQPHSFYNDELVLLEKFCADLCSRVASLRA
jgi:putative methionine-R-sulfoxide reductase with GAF domain